MNDNINERIEKLEQLVKAENTRLSRSVIINSVVYVLLVVFVFGYTTFTISFIKEAASPKTVAVMVTEKVKAQIPSVKKYIKEKADKQSPEIADQVVKYIHGLIPQMEEAAKTQIDVLTDALIERIKNEYMPKLIDHFKATLDKAQANSDVVKDKDVAKHLSNLLVDELDGELSNIINNELMNKIDYLKQEVYKLASKPKAELTNREYAEKKFLLTWIYLVKNGDTSGSSFVESLQFMTDVAKHIDKSLLPEKK
jgi:hypothetical protein